MKCWMEQPQVLEWSKPSNPASWSVDDGSAAHEPESVERQIIQELRDYEALLSAELVIERAKVADLTVAYNAIVTELRRVQGENERLRALLNCVEPEPQPALDEQAATAFPLRALRGGDGMPR